MAISRVFARPMLASMFVVGGLKAVRSPDPLAPRAEAVTDRLVPLLQQAFPALPSDPATLTRINGGVQLVAGAALATGRLPRLSAAALALSLVPATRTQQRLHFFKNVSMFGGLVIAAGDTEGQPGVVWRTRRAAKDARREAKHLAGAARREARLAKAKVT